MPTADRKKLLAALVSPPERLDEVRYHSISFNPLWVLLGGLRSPVFRLFDNRILIIVICVLVKALS
jgi:hypothetical protein